MDGRARSGYRNVAEAYDLGRPGYPEEVVDRAVVELALMAESRVAEVGAGTGKLTVLLQWRVANVVAIEPVEGMRVVLARNAPSAEIVAGTAESMPLGNASVDAVLVADAFHWFDAPVALAEFARVLRPGGRLAILKHAPDRREATRAWEDEVEALIAATAPFDPRMVVDAPLDSPMSWRTALRKSPAFDPIYEEDVVQIQRQDRGGYLGYLSSRVFISLLADAARRELFDEILRVLDAHDVEEIVHHHRLTLVVLTLSGAGGAGTRGTVRRSPAVR